MRIVATKLEHLADGGVRYCPIFPELRAYLEGAWQAAPAGATHVISEVHRSPKANLRTTFEKIVLRAGLVPWEKLFQNMRSSRQTELSERFPLHTVCSWLGNSPAIASRHYLQVRDAHFEEALKPAMQDRAQNRAQSASDSGVLEKTDPTTNERKSLSVGHSPAWTTEIVGDKGLEPLTPCL